MIDIDAIDVSEFDTIKDLQTFKTNIIQKIDKEISDRKEAGRQRILELAQELAKESGEEPEYFLSPTKKQASKKAKAEPKIYANPNDPTETYTAVQGKSQPAWFKNALKAGNTRESMEIKNDS